MNYYSYTANYDDPDPRIEESSPIECADTLPDDGTVWVLAENAGDAWIKSYSREDEKDMFTTNAAGETCFVDMQTGAVIPVHVRRTGTHPGTARFWIDPAVEVWVPKITFSITYYADDTTMGSTGEDDCELYRSWAQAELEAEYPDHIIEVVERPSPHTSETDDENRRDEIIDFCGRLWDRCPWDWKL